MENTKENLIKLMEVEQAHLHRLATYWREEENAEQYHRVLNELSSINDFLNLMKNQTYFNRRVEIYKDLLEEVR